MGAQSTKTKRWEQRLMTTGNLVTLRLEERSEGGRVAYVTVDNVAKRNALGVQGKIDIARMMKELSLDPELRCVVITGAGDKSFIGGANIGEMHQFPDASIAEEGSRNTHLCCDSIRRVPVPVIARINGYCLGAGMEIATCCDMRVASDNAMFGMPEVKWGLPSGMECCLLPRLIGWGKTQELVFTGEMIDAREAFQFGFLERLVTPAELDGAVEKWVKSIVTAGPRAIRLQKELNRDWERMSFADSVQQGIRAVGRAHQTDEPRRMMQGFAERRRQKTTGTGA
jgi:enoyl-CoA hydratase/carnithine racemase